MHSLKRVTLDNPLQKNGTTDSDGDRLTDYKEVTDYLIQWNTDGSVKKLPTLGDAYMYVSVQAYARFPKAMVAKMLGTKVLPVKSDPREKDSDGDGYLDKEDRRPLIYDDDKAQVYIGGKSYSVDTADIDSVLNMLLAIDDAAYRPGGKNSISVYNFNKKTL